MDINFIAAMTKDRVIGIKRTNCIPWKLPSDLKHFKEATTGQVVLMGRNTFESIGKPLSNRINIIVTRAPIKTFAQSVGDTCFFYNSLDLALECARRFSDKKLFVIGGESIFNQLLGECKKIYLTTLDMDSNVKGQEFEYSFFPQLDGIEWNKVSSSDMNEENGIKYVYEIYERINTKITNNKVVPSLKEIANEIGELLEEKNKVYGSAFDEGETFLKLLYPNGIKVDQYGDVLCLARMFDKMKRIATRKDAFNENPYKDLCGYSILGVHKDMLKNNK
jgi:dihydrofolate reductase